uniref:Protein kinase domain-containing protein n=1 Tax=Ditylenchus dipsaci TaxID=166011 RepID=A0A915CSQ8_9BILA
MVKYLHDHELQIAYLDLKPANILIGAGGILKLADFGLSKPSACISGRCGTPRYMAPEDRASKNSDLYSLGVILHEMVFGDEALELAKLKNTSVSSEILEYLTRQYDTNRVGKIYSVELKDIIEGLIKVKPSERIGSEEKGGIRSIENSPWYKLMYNKVKLIVRDNDKTRPVPRSKFWSMSRIRSLFCL